MARLSLRKLPDARQLAKGKDARAAFDKVDVDGYGQLLGREEPRTLGGGKGLGVEGEGVRSGALGLRCSGLGGLMVDSGRPHQSGGIRVLCSLPFW